MGENDAVSSWLEQHAAAISSADCAKQAAAIERQAAACKQHDDSKCSDNVAHLKAGTGADAPGLLRSAITNQKSGMFPTGHDDPRSLLDGACERQLPYCLSCRRLYSLLLPPMVHFCTHHSTACSL
jgi:hypothetical protein